MEPNIHQFREPSQCAYWDDPKPVRSTPMKELFELIDTYAHESHLRSYRLKCRECEQLYFFEFYEWVDWENGNDPQYSKYIPISNLDYAEMLKNAEPHDIIRFFSISQHRFPERRRSGDDVLGRQASIPPSASAHA